MKSGIHPENYRPVAFRDISNGETFISRSTVTTREKEVIDGVEYPLVKYECGCRWLTLRKFSL